MNKKVPEITESIVQGASPHSVARSGLLKPRDPILFMIG